MTKLWSIAGNTQKLDGGAMFGNAPKAMWEHWAQVDGENRIELACRALLATPLHGKTVLFETGIGAFFEPKLRQRYGVQEDRHVLLDSLHEAGFRHEDIDVVVLSHLHFDHVGGLFAAWQEWQPPRLLFPNATFVVVRSIGSAPCIRIRVTVPVSSRNCPACWKPAGDWNWSKAIIRGHWVMRCDSTTAMAIRRD